MSASESVFSEIEEGIRPSSMQDEDGKGYECSYDEINVGKPGQPVYRGAKNQSGSRLSSALAEPLPIPQPLTDDGSKLERVLKSNSLKQETSGSTRRAFLALALIFLTSVLALVVVYKKFPKLEREEIQYVKLPANIEDAKNLGRILSRYTEMYFPEVVGGVFIIYIFLQTFAIPGSIFLSILSGYLFPFWMALFLVCFCSAVGASFCYLLSYLVGRRIVSKYFPEKAMKWSKVVHHHRSNLLNYIIFLRITPFLPNWFINLSSPIVGVPLFPFFAGTFIGVAPPSFVAIQAGTTLYQLTSSSDAISWNSVLLLAVFAILSLIPVLLKQKLRDKFE